MFLTIYFSVPFKKLFFTFGQHFFLEILRTKHGVWHMWIWYLGEPEEAGQFRYTFSVQLQFQDHLLFIPNIIYHKYRKTAFHCYDAFDNSATIFEQRK